MKSMLCGAWMRGAAVALVGVLATGCTLENGSAPDVTGPSEFGLSVGIAASPDVLPLDGSSQSIVTVTVRDENGNPVAGRRLVASASIGSLTVSDVVTGAEGRASFTFVAPGPGTVGNRAVVWVAPVGTDAGNTAARTVSIALLGPANSTLPTADFTFTPAAPRRNDEVLFDASNTRDEGVPCLDSCTYEWSFGDGATGSGRFVGHAYSTVGTFRVSLTVTDAAGSRASVSKSVTVAAVAAPTVTLTFAPATPAPSSQVTFNAVATPAAGHSIAQYVWDFGDGETRTTTTGLATKTYSTAGTYPVSVTVTDDLGQTGSALVSVEVKVPTP